MQSIAAVGEERTGGRAPLWSLFRLTPEKYKKSSAGPAYVFHVFSASALLSLVSVRRVFARHAKSLVRRWFAEGGMRRCYFVQEMDGDDGGHVASVGKVFKVGHADARRAM